MCFRKSKAKRWTKKIIEQNLNTIQPVDCVQLIHDADKKALEVLKKIPLLEKACSKILAFTQEPIYKIVNMSCMTRITEKQVPKIHLMVKSICKKIGIDMPELYLCLDRTPNAYVIGAEKYTIVVHSGLLECFEEDEIYAVLAHECGHIACKHGVYHTLGRLVLGGGKIGLDEIAGAMSGRGILGSIVGGVVSLIDNALELAMYQWYRASEFSADRVAAICCGDTKPVVETMMRLAGGTTNIGFEIDTDLFAAQADSYQEMVKEDKINKALEFMLTKNETHPLLAVRASEIKKFGMTETFQKFK